MKPCVHYLDLLDVLNINRLVLAEPMSFSDLMTRENLFLFSTEAVAMDFSLFPNEPLSESDEDEGVSTPSSTGPSFGAIMFSSAEKKLLDMLAELEKERDALKEEVAELKKQLGEN